MPTLACGVNTTSTRKFEGVCSRPSQPRKPNAAAADVSPQTVRASAGLQSLQETQKLAALSAAAPPLARNKTPRNPARACDGRRSDASIHGSGRSGGNKLDAPTQARSTTIIDVNAPVRRRSITSLEKEILLLAQGREPRAWPKQTYMVGRVRIASTAVATDSPAHAKEGRCKVSTVESACAPTPKRTRAQKMAQAVMAV